MPVIPFPDRRPPCHEPEVAWVIARRRAAAIDQPPTLHATPTPAGPWVLVWCPHCRHTHIHGAAGVADGTRPHRAAPCSLPGSPFAVSGYFLRLAPSGEVPPRRGRVTP